MSPDTLRIGIVGIGPHFQEDLFPSLARVMFKEDISVTAFCDRSDESRKWVTDHSYFAQAYITPNIEDAELWNRVDCIICNSWPNVHEYVLARAIREGKHCLCEKPVAASSSALAKILQEGIPQGLVLKVGHVFRYRHGGRAFIEELCDQPLACMNLQYTGSRPHGGRWGFDSRKAFSLTHLTHAIDFIMASAGEIEKVIEAAWMPSNGKESLTATFKTSRCPAVTLWATNAARAFRLDALGVLENGAQVRMEDLDSVYITGLPEDGKRSGPFTKPDFFYHKELAFKEEMLGFLAEVRGTEKCLLPGLQEGQRVLSVIEEIEGRG